MATYTLRVNSDISTSGTWTRFGGPATNWGALSDVNNLTGVNTAGSTERTMQLGLAPATGTIPGSEVIIAVTPYLVMYDSRTSFVYASFDAKVGIYTSGFPVSEAAYFVSQVPSTQYTTVQGPRMTYPPGQPNADWSLAAVDALNLQIRSQTANNYYEAYIVVETITAGSVTVSAPTATIVERGPVIQWSYSIGAQYQGAARVKVFTSAQYTGGGFNPDTSAAFSSATIQGSANTWDTYYDPKNGGATRGTILPDGAYRAYVWVNQIGTNQWYGGTFTSFTVADTVTVPTLASALSNSTVTTGTPTLAAYMAAQAGGATKQGEFLIASDSGFTNNVQTLLDASVMYSGTAKVTVPAGSKLAQGTWWVKARAKDQFGTYSAYTTAVSFTVQHVPAASALTPALGISSAYATTKVLSWTFSDPSATDTQTAYQVVIGKGSNLTATIDSGIVASAVSSHTATIDASYKDVDIWWRVRVRDGDNVWSAYSDIAIFHTSDLPSVAVTNPANAAVVTTPTPTLAWTFTASGGRTQAAWRAYITNTDAAPDVIVEDSGWTTGTAVTWTPALPVVDLATNYTATVELKDNNGLVGTATNAFTATYTVPDAFTYTVTAATYSVDGAVLLDWTTAVADGNFVAWRVYRRPVGGTYKLVREITTATTKTFTDYTSPSNTNVEYAIVQAATRFGLVVESPYQATAFIGDNQTYMVVVPDNPTLNLTLYKVRGDSFSDELESSTHNVIGRGRVVQYGTKYGKTGTLDCQFYDNDILTARAQRLAVEAVRDSGLAAYMRNPFGDVWPVSLVNLSVTRIAGVGNREYATAQITYSEVDD